MGKINSVAISSILNHRLTGLMVVFLFLEQHIYYVFCLLKLDGQVLDTALVETDESETDISFDNIIVL